jgi:hypothetical protein
VVGIGIRRVVVMAFTGIAAKKAVALASAFAKDVAPVGRHQPRVSEFGRFGLGGMDPVPILCRKETPDLRGSEV